MTDSEKLELLWSHYQKQIDENKMIIKHINGLYKGLKEISDSDTELSNLIIKEINKLTKTVNNLLQK